MIAGGITRKKQNKKKQNCCVQTTFTRIQGLIKGTNKIIDVKNVKTKYYIKNIK